MLNLYAIYSQADKDEIRLQNPCRYPDTSLCPTRKQPTTVIYALPMLRHTTFLGTTVCVLQNHTCCLLLFARPMMKWMTSIQAGYCLRSSVSLDLLLSVYMRSGPSSEKILISFLAYSVYRTQEHTNWEALCWLICTNFSTEPSHTISLHLSLPLSLALILTGDHKVSRKERCWLHFLAHLWFDIMLK